MNGFSRGPDLVKGAVLGGCLALVIFNASFASRLWKAAGNYLAPVSALQLVPVSDSQPALDLGHLPRAVNVLILFSPGFHCSAPQSSVEVWERAVAEADERWFGGFLVADGHHCELRNVRSFDRPQGLPVYLDADGSVRRRYGLHEGPFVLGLGPRGEEIFRLPLFNINSGYYSSLPAFWLDAVGYQQGLAPGRSFKGFP